MRDRLVGILVVAAWYFPIFGKIIPIVRDFPFHFAYYGVAVLAPLALAGASRIIRARAPLGRLLPLLLFGVFTTSFLVIKGAVAGDTQPLAAKGVGVLLGSASLLAFFSAPNPQRAVTSAIAALSAAFSVQCGLSLYESYSGQLLGTYEVSESVALVRREILPGITDVLSGAVSAQMPLTGLLGQHNYFGNMLVFLNLIWISEWLLTRKARFLHLTALTLFATVVNTTRVALFLVVASSAIAVIYRWSAKAWRPAAALLFVGAVAEVIRLNLWSPTSGVESNTLVTRLDLWTFLISEMRSAASAWTVLVGLPPDTLFRISDGYFGVTTASFENQFLALLMFVGPIGVALYVWAMIVAPLQRHRGHHDQDTSRLVGFLWVVSATVTSLFLDTNWHFASYVAIVIIQYRLLGPVAACRDSVPELYPVPPRPLVGSSRGPISAFVRTR